MRDENQQQPIPAPVEAQTPTPLVKFEKIDKRKTPKGVLATLPKTIKDDMDEFMRTNGAGAALNYMTNKYGQQFPALMTLKANSYYTYFKNYNVKVSKELALQSEVAKTPPELLSVIENISDTSVSLADKRAALTALYNDCATTSKMLQQRQTNFIDPAIEALILANRKQMCVIIEKVAVLNDQLTKESNTDWLAEASYLMQIMEAAVVNSYKTTHQDQTHFSMFISTVTENLTNLLKSYKATKENSQKANPNTP
jgi:alpha-amylase/alpha-mannosidase (GH57 family)